MLYSLARETRSGILCYIFPFVERALVFCVIYFRVWDVLWYSVLYFYACGMRTGIMCYIFLCMERDLVFFIVFFRVWNAHWYFVLYFSHVERALLFCVILI